MASPDIQIREDTIYGASKPNNGGSEKAILGWATNDELYRLRVYLSGLMPTVLRNQGIIPWDRLNRFGGRLNNGLAALRMDENDELVRRVCLEARTRGFVDGIAVKLGKGGLVSPPLDHELALWDMVGNQDRRAFQKVIPKSGRYIKVHGTPQTRLKNT